jgi:type II secretory pathway pseudopilin PulG
MTDPHGPDRLDALIVKSTATQVASAQVLRQAYDLLQAAHSAIERARSLQRRPEITFQDDDGSLATHGAPKPESRGEIGSVGQGAGPLL